MNLCMVNSCAFQEDYCPLLNKVSLGLLCLSLVSFCFACRLMFYLFQPTCFVSW